MSKWQPGDSWLHYNYREDVSYVYINIPKNASSWMKENFGGYFYDWRANQFRSSVDSAITLRRGLLATKKYLVILRDPIDRWCTGFAQSYVGGDLKDPNYFAHQRPDRWVDLIPQDDHIRAQCDFLRGLDHAVTTWFDCGHQLTSDIKNWMQGKFDHAIKELTDDEHNLYNISSKGTVSPSTGLTQQEIINQVRYQLSIDPHSLSRLKAKYGDDYALRESVTFYGSR